MLDSFDFDRIIKWPKSLNNDARKEFERLQSDGHEMIEHKRGFTIHPTIEGMRNTMLYRTFIHEVGHYVEYLEKVERPSQLETEDELWEKYCNIPTPEKESFAHSHAEKVGNLLQHKGLIPYDRILNKKSMAADKLALSDFTFE